MKILSKKFLAVLLAGMMLLPLAACAETEDDPENTKASTESNTEVDTSNQDYVCDLPDDLDFKNATVTLLYVKRDGRSDEMPSEKLGLGTISDAVYERNVAVENQLNVKLSFVEEVDDATASSSLKTMVQAGDKSVELSTIGTYFALGNAIEGCHLDMSRLMYMDTSKHYWSQEYNEIATFTSDNMQFLATSPAALSLFRLTYLTIYNRELFAERNLPDLYKTVEEGKWTLDCQYGLVADEYVDKDGDGSISEGDFYGFITGDIISVDAYTVASGIRFIVRDENGDWVSNMTMSENLLNMAEKVSDLYTAQGSYVYKGTSYDDIGKYSIIEKFAAEGGLMATTQFLSIEKRIDALADISYGIVPMPKLSVGQEKYHTYVQDQLSAFGISAAVGDQERQELLGALMESIAYNSYLIVRPAYYDSTLSLRFMQDPQSGEILDMMFETISFDRAYLNFSVDIKGTMRDKLPSSNPALSSQLRAWEKGIQNALTKEQRSLDKLTKS